MNRSRLHSLRNIAAALLACAGFASCTQDELEEQGTPLPVGQYPLELTAGGLQAVATPAQSATRGTMDGDWDGVTKVKVRVNDKDEKEYKVEAYGDNKTALLTPEFPLRNDDELFWWTSTGEQKTVTAWAPSEYALDGEIPFPTEWKEEDFTKYDVIGVRKNIKFTDNPKSLEFQHLMAKVVINLRRTDYLEKAQDIKVQLIGFIRTGILKILSNQLCIDYKVEGGVNITPYRLSSENYEEVDFGNGQREKPFASYMALVVPLNLTNTNVLQIEVDGATYLVTKAALNVSQYGNVYYRPGQVTTFNIRVKENELEVSIDYNTSIDWGTDGNTGSGEVELP